MTIIADQGGKTPFLSEEARSFLRRRGEEIAGIALAAIAVAMAFALGSYNVDDPSFFNATPASPTNFLGVPGAWFSDALIRTLGLAAWGLPLSVGVWGWRLIAHQGVRRALIRSAFAPFAIVLTAMAFSANQPFPGWSFDSGLGGIIGDVLLLQIISITPFSASMKLIVLAMVFSISAFVVWCCAFGVSRAELAASLRWMTQGLRSSFGWIGVHSAGCGVRAFNTVYEAAQKRRSTPRSEKMDPPAPIGGARRVEPQLGEIDEEEDFVERVVASSGSDGDGEDASGRRPTVRHRATTAPRKSRRAAAEEQPSLELEEEDGAGYAPPALSFLQSQTRVARADISDAALEENARMLESVLDDYGVRGAITSVKPGPVVTMYELEPAPGLKASRVIGLSDDIARSMSALSARVSTIPGRNVIGIELPNAHRETVLLRELLSASQYGDTGHSLPLALGKDIGGDPVIANLARMPHLLIAGTTGSGKSVAINTMILSLLYALSPQQCRMIMIDPKMLELSVYDGIPHLLSPVVTDPKKAVVALKWVVREMEERYRRMSKMGVRNIDGYNARVRAALEKGEEFNRIVQTGFDDATGEPIFEEESFAPEEMPFIVVVVDEMADLMMVAGKEIEACIQRLAQMARASGIHIVMATQRPSVDVITGTIKANFPTRISFQVTSKVDSRTILGEQGAEQLLGMGDMLYMSGGGRVTRVHGPFVSDEEVEEIVKHLKTQGTPEYVESVTEEENDAASAAVDQILGLGGDDSDASLYDQAVAIVARDRKCSTSYIQRKLQIGYNRAARLVEQMEDQGVVSTANHVGKREVLIEER